MSFATAVLGIGAVDVPSLLLEVEYHSKFVPVAINGSISSPTQYFTGDVTVGFAGIGFTVTKTLSVVPVQ